MLGASNLGTVPEMSPEKQVSDYTLAEYVMLHFYTFL